MPDTNSSKKIAIITGSTRAVRIGPSVTKFVTSVFESNPSTKFEFSTVDIASFNLPVFDEAVVPASVPFAAQFAHSHSIAWSAEIAKYDGYVLITACYNQGPPGGIKNAIDYLYNEIKGKPFLIISYGMEGGEKASDSLAVSLKSMHTVVMETRPMLSLAKNEPFEFGMPLDLRLAATGKLGDDTLKAWEEKKKEILKGFGELKQFLEKGGEVKAAESVTGTA
ncbi:related to flavoprotein [Phialocephala subalpina]|uniref:Related to flavoprotein n=1 Tax=Phialocephala subalpina TaxID=576137 RepID=A0A1L7WX16_9HELO|nr:related to flavoprotein [Phialocephala subalpina]